MRPSPWNSQTGCTRWRSRRRRRAKAEVFFTLSWRVRKSKRGPGSLRLGLLDFGLARHRGYTECGDPVALAAQHAKTEAVEGEALAAVGDRARLVDHEARDG